MSYNKRRQKNSEPQRWLMMGIYPCVLFILFLGFGFWGWTQNEEPQEDETVYLPATYENFNLRDADEWIDKVGIKDVLDPVVPEDMSEYKNILDDLAGISKKDRDPEAEVPIDEGISKDESAISKVMKTLEEGDYYYYSILSESDQKLYAEIYTIYNDIKDLTKVSVNDLEKVLYIKTLVENDHPEFFYVSGYYWNEGADGSLSYSGMYSYNEGEILSRRLRNDEVADAIINGMPYGLSEYEIVKYLYEYLAENTVYDLGSADNQEYSSVFLNRRSVCAGYSHALQYLLQKCGIQCIYVSGDSSAGPHAWNIARIDGQYYQIDVTWGDIDKNSKVEINYAYLCIPTSKISVNHTADEEIPIPGCNSMDANYFVMEDYYVTDLDDAYLQDIFDRSIIQNNGVVYMMASDSRVYNALKNYLIDTGMTYTFYYADPNSYKGYSYYTYDDTYCIIIYN